MAQNASTPFTVRRLEDLEVKHMSWQLDQLEPSPEPEAHDSGHRRNLSEILYPALKNSYFPINILGKAAPRTVAD